MTVAVTGASGHIGGALVRLLLDEGHNVRALVHRDDASLRGLPVEIFRGNVEDVDTLCRFFDGAEVVQHLASRISIGDVPERVLRQTNVGGAQNVLQACRQIGVRRLIYFSSVHAFRAVSKTAVFDESAPPATAFPYERTKAAAQALALSANGVEGLETLCLNPTAVLGPYDFKPSLQGQMVLDLLHGRIPMLTPGGFDWVDNRDVARVAVSAMTHGRPGEVYLIGGKYATMLDLAAMIGRIVNRPMPSRAVPFALLKALSPVFVAWSRLSGQRPLFTREALSHVELGHPNVSTEKAKRELGYAPRPLEDTLNDVIDWFRQMGAFSSPA